MGPAGRDFDALFGEFECDFAIFYLIMATCRKRTPTTQQAHTYRIRIFDVCASCMDGPGNREMVGNG